MPTIVPKGLTLPRPKIYIRFTCFAVTYFPLPIYLIHRTQCVLQKAHLNTKNTAHENTNTLAATRLFALFPVPFLFLFFIEIGNSSIWWCQINQMVSCVGITKCTFQQTSYSLMQFVQLVYDRSLHWTHLGAFFMRLSDCRDFFGFHLVRYSLPLPFWIVRLQWEITNQKGNLNNASGFRFVSFCLCIFWLHFIFPLKLCLIAFELTEAPFYLEDQWTTDTGQSASWYCIPFF